MKKIDSQTKVPTLLNNYISQGEHCTQDFKFEINDAKKIAITISAFCNTSGGKLLIGVKDNGKIAGIRSDEEYYMIEAACSLYCKPSVPFTYTNWELEKKTVLEINFAESIEKPILAKNEEGEWIAYIRVDDQNFKATPIHLELWKNSIAHKIGKELTFSKNEQLILELLKENLKSTINQLQKKSKLKRHILIKTLSKLVKWEVVNLSLKNDKYFFEINNDLILE